MSIAALLSLAMGSAMMTQALPNLTPTQKQITQNQKNTKGSSTRVSPSGRYKRHGNPQVKQSFKQSQRNEFTQSRKKRHTQF